MTTPTDQHRERANKLAFQLTGDPPHNPGDIAAILAAFAEVEAEAEERGAREQREADARLAGVKAGIEAAASYLVTNTEKEFADYPTNSQCGSGDRLSEHMQGLCGCSWRRSDAVRYANAIRALDAAAIAGGAASA